MSRIACFILSLACAASAWGADVRLKSVITAEPGLPVRLSHIAELTGKDAETVGDIVLIDDPAASLGSRRWITLTPEDVRKAMRANSMAPSRHTINGRTVHVRVRTVRDTTPQRPEVAEREHESISLEGPETVRTRIARTLAQRYGVTNDDLRVLFDTGTEPLLDREIAGLTPVVRPLTSHLSDRLRVEVMLVRAEAVVASGVVTGTAQVRREVALVTQHLTKDEVITPQHVRTATMWVSPNNASASVTVKEAIGQRATHRLDPQQTVRARDVEPPVAVRRGDTVVVLTVGGGVSIETKARVLRDGVVGERVSCRLHRASEPFEGVVTAPGRVLVNLDLRSDGTASAKSHATPAGGTD